MTGIVIQSLSPNGIGSFIIKVSITVVLLSGLHAWWVFPSIFNEGTQEALSRTGEYLQESRIGLEWNSNHSHSSYSQILKANSYIVGKGNQFGSNQVQGADFFQTDAYAFISTIIAVAALLLSSFLIRKAPYLILPLGVFLILFCPIMAGRLFLAGLSVGFSTIFNLCI